MMDVEKCIAEIEAAIADQSLYDLRRRGLRQALTIVRSHAKQEQKRFRTVKEALAYYGCVIEEEKVPTAYEEAREKSAWLYRSDFKNGAELTQECERLSKLGFRVFVQGFSAIDCIEYGGWRKEKST